jgi:hypothetical protein
MLAAAGAGAAGAGDGAIAVAAIAGVGSAVGATVIATVGSLAGVSERAAVARTTGATAATCETAWGALDAAGDAAALGGAIAFGPALAARDGDGGTTGVERGATSAGSGRSVGCGTGVTSGKVASMSGVDVETATVLASGPRLPTTDNAAPMTNPKITTPMMMGTNGSDAPPFGGVRRERRGRFSCINERVSRQEDTMLSSKRHRVIRVPVPIDVRTISETESCAFALATPIRVERLLVLAVHEALGIRAPQDKRERSIDTMLAGFSEGKFVVDVDGRIFDRPDAVVVCTGVAVLRFFSTEARRERARVR